MASKKFAKDYQIQYECVMDHDAYNFLRVSIEVDRARPETHGEVCLNGVPVGLIEYIGKKQFKATRYQGKERVNLGEFSILGRAAAAIITDFIK